MIILYIFLALVAISVILISAMSYRQFKSVCYPKVIPTLKTIEIENDKGLTDKNEYIFFKERNKFTLDIDGLKLCAAWSRASAEKSDKVVIICHGYLYSMVESYKYAKAFNALGFDALIYDQPAHGESAKIFHDKKIPVGMGFLEAKTLVKIVDYVKSEQENGNGYIGVMGESMGGVTALLAAEMDERIKFVVAHCVPKTIDDGFKFTLRKRKKRWQIPLIPFANLWTKAICDFSYEDVDGIKAVRNLKIPILFCHGDKDNTVPYDNALCLFNEKKEGIKRLYIARGARHDTILTVNQQKYLEELSSFINIAEKQIKSEEKE